MQMRRLLILVTCLALLTTVLSMPVASASVPTNQTSDVTFSTPEDAIRYFFDGVAQGDFSKILQASAINEISKNFRFDLSIDRLRAFMPYQEYAPSTSSFYVELNNATITSRIANQVKIFAYSLLVAGDDIQYDRINRMEMDAALHFMNEVDPARLATLEVKEIGLPDPEIMATSRYQMNAANLARVYGADESTERVARFTFEGNSYMLGFTLLRYDESWKITSTSSPLAGTSALGTSVPISEQEFADMTSES